MTKDKTVISIPPIYFYQYGPNLASLIGAYTYNEGIYLKNESLSKTYAKSVVRIYKNPKIPKKIYLFSKDTSLYEAFAGQYKTSSFDEVSSYIGQDFAQQYLGTDEDTLKKFSLFKQPENFISLDQNTLNNKTINFYTLTTDSINTLGKVIESFETETTTDTNIELLENFISSINEWKDFLGCDGDGILTVDTPPSFEQTLDNTNKAAEIVAKITANYSDLVDNSVFSESDYLTNLSIITTSLPFVTTISTLDTTCQYSDYIIGALQKMKETYAQSNIDKWTTQPTNFAQDSYLNTIQTSYYLKSKSIIADYGNDNKTYTRTLTNLFEQTVYTNWGGPNYTGQLGALNETDIQLYKSTTISKTKQFDFSEYVENKYSNLWVQKIDRYKSGESSDVYDNYVFLDPYNVDSSAGPEILRENRDTPTEKDQILLNMKGKYCLLIKKDVYLFDTYTNRDYFIANSDIRPDTEYVYGKVSWTVPEGNTYAYAALGRQENKILGSDYSINFNDYNIQEVNSSDLASEKPYIYIDSLSKRKTQFENFSFDTGLSTLYIFNDSFQQEQEEKYGFVMDDPYDTVYEIELEEELDIENGTFMVVEIE